MKRYKPDTRLKNGRYAKLAESRLFTVEKPKKYSGHYICPTCGADIPLNEKDSHRKICILGDMQNDT